MSRICEWDAGPPAPNFRFSWTWPEKSCTSRIGSDTRLPHNCLQKRAVRRSLGAFRVLFELPVLQSSWSTFHLLRPAHIFATVIRNSNRNEQTASFDHTTCFCALTRWMRLTAK